MYTMNQKLIQKRQPLGNELQLQLLISSQEIEERLERTARMLKNHYSIEELIVAMILRGSFILVGDFLRRTHLSIRLEAVQAASCGEGSIVKGEQEVMDGDSLEIKGEHVFLVDDIFDIGEPPEELSRKIQDKKPASFQSLVLLSKDVPHNTRYRPDISLFDIEDRFVVGYGLGYKEYYRGLPDIYSVEM